MFGNYYQPQGLYQPNPYERQLAQMRGQMPPQQVTRVSGIESARQIPLAPNSTMLALDYDDRHVYAVYSGGDGHGQAVRNDAVRGRAAAGRLRHDGAVREMEGGGR